MNDSSPLKMNIKDRPTINRRRFVKTFTFATAYSSLLGKAWTTTLAGEIKLHSTSTTGTLRLKLTDFPALLTESGSVRLAINPVNGTMPNGQFYPVIINRAANNVFHALNSRCTHQNCIVEPLDSGTKLINCLCHGSIFAIDGRRIAGPASSALAKYSATFDGSNLLELKIPGLGYTITASSVEPANQAAPRIRLDFRALRNVEYEVHFRESLEKESSVVPFSLTPTDPAEQTLFSGSASATVSLFLDRTFPSGFYSIAVRLTPM